MMAVGLPSGALLLVVLIGTSYSYPVKKGGDQSSSGGGDSTNPGYGYQHPSGGYVSISGSQPASYPAAAAYSSSYYPAAPAQYPGGYLPGSVQPSLQPGAPQAYSWEVDPVKPLPVETSSSLGASSGLGDAESFGPSSGFIPGPPTYQGGELSHVEKTYEHGNSDSETEDQGSPRFPGGPVPFPLPGPFPLPDGSAPSVSGLYLPPGGPGFGFPWYPYYDYQFLTGQYPPGTVSHFSTSYEQGRDHYHDNHYIRDLPIIPGHPQVPVYPPVQQHQQQQLQ
ncbi:calcium-binding protein P-like [Amphiprion ocellaris]|uniref:calcium-binding protein P-like n=1 Tax=Amphiprion ocellaris TaxID=80972 RepID=UPI000C31B670|nr:calcium-binding protein P-like [Amphiprion ocellaris]